MPSKTSKTRNKLPELLLLARPRQPLRVRVKLLEGLAILEGEDGSIAVVPTNQVCILAERLNLIVEGYKCS